MEYGWAGGFGDELAVADVDADGVVEVIWSTDGDLFLVGDGPGDAVEWTSVELGGPMYVAAGDVDGDGRAELLVASRSANDGWTGGVVQLLDPASSIPVWSVVSVLDIEGIRLGQVDAHPGLEVVIAGHEWYDPFVQVLDAATGAVEWSSARLGEGPVSALEVAGLDDGDWDEIVVGFGDRIWVLDGGTSRIQWDSGVLEGDVRDVAVGNLDTDAAPELAILTARDVLVVHTATWTEQTALGIEDGQCVLLVPGQLLVVNSRTYNQTGSGTYGQGIPGRTAAEALTSRSPAYLTQLHENADFRTNLGLLEVSGVGAVVEVRLLAADGSQVQGRVHVLRPLEPKQVNRVFGAGAEVTGGYAEVFVWGGGAVLAYASVVDNRTGDPTYIEPQ